MGLCGATGLFGYYTTHPFELVYRETTATGNRPHAADCDSSYLAARKEQRSLVTVRLRRIKRHSMLPLLTYLTNGRSFNSDVSELMQIYPFLNCHHFQGAPASVTGQEVETRTTQSNPTEEKSHRYQPSDRIGAIQIASPGGG
jgi:hypothetical protein